MDKREPRRTLRLDTGQEKVTIRTEERSHSMVHQHYYMEVVEQGNTDTA